MEGISSGRRFPPSAASCLRSLARSRYRRGRGGEQTCAWKFYDENGVRQRQPFVPLLVIVLCADLVSRQASEYVQDTVNLFGRA